MVEKEPLRREVASLPTMVYYLPTMVHPP